MTEPLNIATVIEMLRSIASPNAKISCEELTDGWRIRVDGGPIVRIRTKGRILISGRNSHVLRKALGLTGGHGVCCSSSEEIKAACAAYAEESGEGRA